MSRIVFRQRASYCGESKAQTNRLIISLRRKVAEAYAWNNLVKGGTNAEVSIDMKIDGAHRIPKNAHRTVEG